MSLILAIEPDRRQTSHLTALAHGPLNVELVVGDTTEHAFEALGPRVPDLVLTSQLMSPKDETALAERLRELDAAGAHVQTLVIPVLGSDEGAKKRTTGGLFGRLRRSTGQGKASEGCDPAVFGTQITEYLERAATERAALAAAQADLEAAWAEQPPSAQSHTNNEHADFGEFAAIPIPSLSVPLHHPAGGAALAAIDDAEPFDATLMPAPTPPVSLASPGSIVPSVPAPAATGATEDEWEEITLDAAPVDSHNDLSAESVDLDAFVQELHTVETTANAQPMIPVVDLTGSAIDDDLHQVRQNEETVSAILQAAEPALDLGDELERAVSPWVPTVPATPAALEPLFEADASFEVDSTFASTASDDSPLCETLPSPPSITASEVAAAFEAECAPVVAAPMIEAPTPPRAGWQDLLSAIRRDISHMTVDDPAPAQPPRTELNLSREPLVFPVRPALTASAIADAMPVRTERHAVDPHPEGAHPSQVAHSLEISLQASLSAPLTLTPEPSAAAAVSEVGELRAAVEAQLANAIKTSENAFAADVAVPDEAAVPLVSSPSTFMLDMEPQADTSVPLLEYQPEPMVAADDTVIAGIEADDPVIAEFEHALGSTIPIEEPATDAAAPHVGVAPIFEDLLAADVQTSPSLPTPATDDTSGLPTGEEPLAVEATLSALEVQAAHPVIVAEAPPRESSRKERSAKHKRRRRNERVESSAPAAGPRAGDCGFFDPQQVGFGALVAKLNEVTRRGQRAALPRR